MQKFRSGVVLLCLVALIPFGRALAQDGGMQSLLDRVDRLERDLNQVQRQLYRNEVGGKPAPVAPMGADSGAPAEGNTALNAEIRMSQIETQLRTMTGQIEELQYNNSQLAARLDKMQADNEVRFQQLEGSAPPPGTPADGKITPMNGKSDTGAGDMSRPASASGSLTAPGAPPAPGTGLAAGSVQDQYNAAFGQLRQNNYAGAEQAFKAFLQRYPTDPLAGNAQYWLGESYFVREDYKNAAGAFAEGYQKYPKSPKAADNLMKLGMSLGRVDRKGDACAAFARLERDFPNMAPITRTKETAEKKRLGC